MLIKKIIKRLFEIDGKLDELTAERSELITRLAGIDRAVKTPEALAEMLYTNTNDKTGAEDKAGAGSDTFSTSEGPAIIERLAARDQGVSERSIRQLYPDHPELVHTFKCMVQDETKFSSFRKGNGVYYYLKTRVDV